MRLGIGSIHRSLGMYPDETCFDTSRPSWLPYFIDDITESTCKMNLLVSGNTTGNTAQPGTFTTDAQGNVVPIADAATVANAQSACASSGGTWNAALQACSPGLLSQVSAPLIIGGVAIVGLLLLLRK